MATWFLGTRRMILRRLTSLYLWAHAPLYLLPSACYQALRKVQLEWFKEEWGISKFCLAQFSRRGLQASVPLSSTLHLSSTSDMASVGAKSPFDVFFPRSLSSSFFASVIGKRGWNWQLTVESSVYIMSKQPTTFRRGYFWKYTRKHCAAPVQLFNPFHKTFRFSIVFRHSFSCKQSTLLHLYTIGYLQLTLNCETKGFNEIAIAVVKVAYW